MRVWAKMGVMGKLESNINGRKDRWEYSLDGCKG